jgi:hypothetical protein
MELHFVGIYILGFIILLVVLFILYIKIKYKFWCIQPVFHFYDFQYWLYNRGIIRYELPEKNKYTNLKSIKTYDFNSLTNKQLQDFIVLIQLNYLRNKENKFYPKKDNIVPYFSGHTLKTFCSLYFKPITIIHNKSSETFTQDEIAGIITSRPLHVQIQNKYSKQMKNFDVYYVDYLCVNKNYRKQQIAPQLIQTHEYNQSHLNRKICVSLFKREEELTGIIPLTIYKTYCYLLRDNHYNIPPLLPSNIQVLTGDKQNLYYFYNFLKEIQQENQLDILIYPELANLIELINSGNIFLKMLMSDGEIIGAYLFRKTCTYIRKEKEIVSCFASIKSKNIDNKNFIIGFKNSLWSIIKDHANFGYVTIENISNNYLLIEDKNKNNHPIAVSPMAYFFYNFAYSPFDSKKCLIIN